MLLKVILTKRLPNHSGFPRRLHARSSREPGCCCSQRLKKGINKMQDNSKEFDLQVRSMLEDAEVKAPRRAWKSISRSLDASSYSYSWGWMKWAGAGLAAAAVVAARSFRRSEQFKDACSSFRLSRRICRKVRCSLFRKVIDRLSGCCRNAGGTI